VKAADILKREQARAAREALELAMALHLRAAAIPFEREYRFHPSRAWRFDFALPAARLAIEVQGGVFSNGRHARGAGITDECEKFAHAVIAGWRVMPVTGAQVKSGLAIQWVKQALGSA
jgi:very-short-patch-repair endonuclease